MSVDLDELFATLRQQADTIPLGGAGPARHRGRHRERVRAAVTVAVAITLVAAGVGVAQGHRADRPVTHREVIPTVGTPVPISGSASLGQVATDGTRAYAAWIRTADNTLWVTATYLRTGAVAWPPREVSTTLTLDRVVVVPSAVVVFARERGAYHLYAFDPASGTPRWGLDGDDADEVVFAGDRVVTVQTSGEMRLNDSATGRLVGGATLDAPSTGNDQYVRVLGMGSASDEKRVGQSGPPSTFDDPRVILISRKGRVWVLNAHNGGTPRSVDPGPAALTGDIAAFDGLLYTRTAGDPATGRQRIRATDLVGNAGSWEVFWAVGTFVTLGPCGGRTVCVVTGQDGHPNKIRSLDSKYKLPLWGADSQVNGDRISTAGGHVMLATADGRFDLYDEPGLPAVPTGRSSPPFASELSGGGWLDSNNVLFVDPEGSGRLARMSLADHKVTVLGAAPRGTQGCASTGTRLVCVTPTALTTWNVT